MASFVRESFTVALCAVAALGCGESATTPTPTQSATPAAITAAPTAAAAVAIDPAAGAAVAPVDQVDPPAVAPEGASAEETAEAPTQTAYEPPFPDRTDLFVPPKREGGAAVQGTGDNIVVLMGFVSVDKPKAVLSINGEVAPLAMGQMHFGVEVISINPPNVVLQRGRQRWQATLE